MGLPVERLEVAWCLRCFPSQVLLVERSPGSLCSLQALRKEVNQLLAERREPAGTWSRAFSAAAVPEELLPLAARSEEQLVLIAERAIELLSLQEVLKACQSRLWKKPEARDLMHRGLLIVGATSPELLYQELVAPSDAELPPGVVSNRLNQCLQNLGLGLLTEDGSVFLRAKAKEFSGRAFLIENGVAPLLVTAPHNIVLVRDSRPPHRMEEHTSYIAERIASVLNGSSLTWSRRQQHRSQLRWSLAQFHGLGHLPGNGCGLLDETNRDPNFLATAEVWQNEWFQKMHSLGERFRRQMVPCAFHFDVHGCRNPPRHAAHLIVGLGAMREQAKRPEELLVLKCLRLCLKQHLGSVVDELDLEPPASSVVVVYPRADEDPPPELCGAISPELGRHTQTQQAVQFAGFAISCQLEMSLSLRKALAADKARVEVLARALWRACNNVA